MNECCRLCHGIRSDCCCVRREASRGPFPSTPQQINFTSFGLARPSQSETPRCCTAVINSIIFSLLLGSRSNTEANISTTATRTIAKRKTIAIINTHSIGYIMTYRPTYRNYYTDLWQRLHRDRSHVVVECRASERSLIDIPQMTK